MDTLNTHVERNTAAIGAFHDLARARAERLRQQAIDDFWKSLGSALSAALHGELRAAARADERLARRLVRHARKEG